MTISMKFLRLAKANYSGGVLALTTEQYRKANGHSNTYWAWGAEGGLFKTDIGFQNLRFLVTKITILVTKLTILVSMPK